MKPGRSRRRVHGRRSRRSGRCLPGSRARVRRACCRCSRAVRPGRRLPVRPRPARREPREIDDDAGSRRVAAVAVPAGPGDDVHAARARPANDLADVGRVERLCDREWVDAVVEAVEDEAGVLVSRRPGRDHRSSQRPGQCADPRIAQASALRPRARSAAPAGRRPQTARPPGRSARAGSAVSRAGFAPRGQGRR